MAIDFSNVQYHYPKRPEHTVLNIPTWSVKKGEKVFVHGPSGCGKSTLLGLLSGLFSPSFGEITVLGQRTDRLSGRQRDRFRAEHIGYVFQQFNLIPYLDAFDNVLLASKFVKRNKIKEINDEIKMLLKALGIPERDWHRPSRALSLGQQQRVAIARALINKPEIIIADEPTSSLDSHTRDSFMELLMSLVADNGITLIFVSHDLSLRKYFSRVESLTVFNKQEG